MTPTHLISLTVGVNGFDEQRHAFAQISEVAKDLSSEYASASVASYQYDEESEEDEGPPVPDKQTLATIKEALGGVFRSFDLPEDPLIRACINEMVRAGIVFRLRSK